MSAKSRRISSVSANNWPAADPAIVMARVAQRDRQAFNQLYEAQADVLYATALRILEDPDEAARVVQDVFLQIWNRAESYQRAAGHPFQWALVLTRNQAIDRLRALKKAYVFVDAPQPEPAGAMPAWLPRKQAAALRMALATLPLEQRQAIEMGFLGGMSHPEIAAALDQPSATIKNRIRKGLQHLRAPFGAPVIDERKETQASLYAVGALPAEELREFEEALRADLQLQLLVDELRAVVHALVMTVPPAAAPATVKEKLGAALGFQAWDLPATEEASDGAVAAGLPWAIAIGLGVLCIVLLWVTQGFRRQALETAAEMETLSGRATQLEQERDELMRQVEQTNSRAAQEIRDLKQEVVQKAEEFQKQRSALEKQLGQRTQELDRQKTLWRRFNGNVPTLEGTDAYDSTLISPEQKDRWAQLRVSVLIPTAESSSRALAAALWDPLEQRGLLAGDNFAPLSPDRDYQLWIFDSKLAAPLNAGVLTVSERGQARTQFRLGVPRLDTIERYAVSIERKGGAPRPQGRIILTSGP